MKDLQFLQTKNNWLKFIIYSAPVGFFAIPIHEFGHVFFYWISGEPAGMSYAREYTFSGNNNTFGILGGPLFPIMVSYVSIFVIYHRNPNLFLFILPTILSFDRVFLYILNFEKILGKRLMGFDEAKLATKLGLPYHTFFIIFFILEILALFLILKRPELKGSRKYIFLIIAFGLFLCMALFGIYVIEKTFFYDQFKIQFG